MATFLASAALAAQAEVTAKHLHSVVFLLGDKEVTPRTELQNVHAEGSEVHFDRVATTEPCDRVAFLDREGEIITGCTFGGAIVSEASVGGIGVENG